jgi:predicted nucleotidyltransferase component of viral defense system
VIAADFIVEWRAQAPWPEDHQVEQDLLLSRALVEMFQEPEVSGILAFRGGTALHKLYLTPARRYSEDLDLVRVAQGSVEGSLAAIRRRLDP